MRDHKSEVNLFRNRVIVAFIGILLFLVLVGSLYRLQVQNFDASKPAPTGTELKVLPISPYAVNLRQKWCVAG
ncbi:hypothetical protein OH492_27830 [Vibrio chagasii]|nr:hypothetical protein [Vibrio chagasii]